MVGFCSAGHISQYSITHFFAPKMAYVFVTYCVMRCHSLKLNLSICERCQCQKKLFVTMASLFKKKDNQNNEDIVTTFINMVMCSFRGK